MSNTNNSLIQNNNNINNNNNNNNTSYFGSIKLIVLILLCLQNCCHALFTRYSKNTLHEEWSEYEAVMISELLKLIISIIFMLYDNSESDSQGNGVYKILWLIYNGKKMIIVVIGYVFSNILSYVALQRIDASVYTVLGQLKLFTTAFFSVCYLNTFVSSTKYRALIILAMGCILVTSPSFDKDNNNNCDKLLINEELNNLNNEKKKSIIDFLIGVGSTLIMVFISGAASVYLEKTLKKDEIKITIWERNVQLAFYSWFVVTNICIYNYLDLFNTGSITYNSKEPFHGWSFLTVFIVFLQAAGGILVAATLKYADSIIRNFATAGAIILSTIIGYFYLGGIIDLNVGIGTICTIVAIFNYTLDTTIPPPISDNNSIVSDSQIKLNK